MSATHTIAQGDIVTVSGRRVGEPRRLGEIVEVLGESARPHFLVRWEDDHESILYPGEATTISPRPARARRAVSAPTELLLDALGGAGAEVEILRHQRTTSAASEARTLGVSPALVAKTVILRTADGIHIRAVVPASSTVSLRKLADVLAKTDVHVLTETELLAAYPQFELGAVPPAGGPAGDTVVVDESLVGAENLVFEAGVHDASVRMRSDDLVRVAQATVADIAATQPPAGS